MSPHTIFNIGPAYSLPSGAARDKQARLGSGELLNGFHHRNALVRLVELHDFPRVFSRKLSIYHGPTALAVVVSTEPRVDAHELCSRTSSRSNRRIRPEAAMKADRFKDEIAPVTVKSRRAMWWWIPTNIQRPSL